MKRRMENVVAEQCRDSLNAFIKQANHMFDLPISRHNSATYDNLRKQYSIMKAKGCNAWTNPRQLKSMEIMARRMSRGEL